ncbi:MAG TPA: hypothetical protein VK463_04275 [Desulfomonilaceae bacterium]|nr:hypothetical protein [Desulfomonilaceae bacterium]
MATAIYGEFRGRHLVRDGLRRPGGFNGTGEVSIQVRVVRA